LRFAIDASEELPRVPPLGEDAMRREASAQSVVRGNDLLGTRELMAPLGPALFIPTAAAPKKKCKKDRQTGRLFLRR